MKNLLLVLVFAVGFSQIKAKPGPKASDLFFRYNLQLLGGYCGGVNGQVNMIFSDFAKGFPFALKIGYAYTNLNPGNALDARRIFINDATNGTPEKKGTIHDGKIDFLYRTKVLKSKNSFIYGGFRYSRFIANFNFIGGNENFDVEQKTYGFGAGVEFYFPINKKLHLTVNTGGNYYIPNMLKGHDTGYSPDGEDINPRNDYDYADADLILNQPKIQLQAVMGMTYKF